VAEKQKPQAYSAGATGNKGQDGKANTPEAHETKGQEIRGTGLGVYRRWHQNSDRGAAVT